MIKVRFAPSPTGCLHIGGARTALFNWMYARAQEGVFVLRIEDTDAARSTKEFEQEILDSMRWLGLNWDELYRQSERFDIYREYAQNLLKEGKAYQDGEAIILTMIPKTIKIYDLIRGEIAFDTATIKDQVLMKSDGTPTYSFACVVDDNLMGISHVIRGEDHISNTPKQVIIYESLGWTPPKYAHLPLIMGEDGSRMSKRTGAVAVSEYRKMGFLPEALINYLMLLGWSPGGNEEKISLKNAVKKFSVKKVNKASAIFSMEKLRWLNGQYIRAMDIDALTEALTPFLQEKGFISPEFDRQRLKDIVRLFQGRLFTLRDFLEWADFAFLEEIQLDPEVREEHFSGKRAEDLSALAKGLEQTDTFEAKVLEETFKRVAAERNLPSGELVHPARVALTGRAVGPSLFEIMEILGKDATIQRLSRFSIKEEK